MAWSSDECLEISCSDSVRLVNGTGLCSGRLEVRFDQRWSPVCEEDLDLQGAQVVCRELGCGAPSVFKGGMFGEVEAPFWTKKFQCEGHESALLDCSESGLTGNTCPPATAVGLTCSDPDDEVRLVGGSSTCSGRLEWKHHGEWRPVKPSFSSWTLKETAVICKRLDCGSAVSSRAIEESSDRPVWWIISGCVESKSTLKECVNTEDYSTSYGLEITCSDSVRLVNGTGLCSGRLEVKSDQRWSPVCEEDLDLQGAQVVCRELGCGAPSVFKGGMFGEMEAPFWTKKFQCEGLESALLDCPESGLTGNTCPPATAVGLTCSDPDEVWLVGGSSTCSGRLEWKHHGEWRIVHPSHSYWTLKFSAVICGRLDCGSAVSSRVTNEPSDRPVWGINPDCVESKSTLKECVNTEDRSSVFGLEITCSDSVRLVNGTGLCSGRLEVRSDQRWSPVCEEDLDLQGAQVVCRELGCGAPSVFKGGMFGEVEAPFWTKKFQCEGHESALLDCGGSGSVRNTCSPRKAVGLSCENPDNYRLVGEPSRCAGTLAMKHMEEWRPLAEKSSHWDQRSAAVVCTVLKCGSAVSTRVVERDDKRPVWWIRGSCVQTASSLFQCVDYRTYSSDNVLEVICSDLLEKPNITFSFSTDGASEATPQGYQALIGTSFNITCSVQPQYEGGDFQLIFSDSNTTQSYTLTVVNHSAHFLFPTANQSHGGQYSCVYHLHAFSHNFSSESQTLSLTVGDPLRDLIIRCVVLLGSLLIYDTALYCYFKVKTKRQPPVLRNEINVEMQIITIPQEST
ncbi:scavenger receptor cysteine-rich type 1 protein M160-like [Cheilinus undulatus]|uniref:scavenger receptor cysteine-rich type 1 protein M160-like n=1 Tax=Cheilinus undulatus TaxID=241271 RepID=UPI001BD40785|nr:scavenger receptor cysteine-rich type 1 protein M160-like [Cheilinus undulatus]